MKNTEKITEYHIVESTDLFDPKRGIEHNKELFQKTIGLTIVNDALREMVDQPRTYGRYNYTVPRIHPDIDWFVQSTMFGLLNGSQSALVMLNKRKEIVAIFKKDTLLTEPSTDKGINILLSDRLLHDPEKAKKILSEIEQQLNTNESVAA